MASGEGAPEAMQYKVSVLKVSIHCEGCKKKVHRILRKIEGVDPNAIEIDARQNKVTVKALADAQTLIQKLKKSGKHAELWHERKPSDQFYQYLDGNYYNKKAPEKSIPFDNSAAASSSPAAKRTDADKAEAVKNKSLTEPKQTKAEPENNTSKEIPKSVEKIAENSKAVADSGTDKAPESREATDSGSNGEKMDKKSKKDSNKESAMNDDSDVGGDKNPSPAFPPQPAYITSYNMAQPSVSQSYYVPPMPAMPPVSQGYMYAQNSYPPPPPPEYYYGSVDAHSSAPAHHPDPYNIMFSDENPNACSLM